MRLVNISIADTTFQYRGVTYAIDDWFNFYILGADGKWHPVNANHVPEDVINIFRSYL